MGVRSLVSVPYLRARLAALRTAPIGPRTYRVITATALVAPIPTRARAATVTAPMILTVLRDIVHSLSGRERLLS